MSQNIVTRCDGRRDDHSPGVVVRDKLVGSPIPIGNTLVDKSDGIDLEPLEGSFVYSLAGTVAYVNEIVSSGL